MNAIVTALQGLQLAPPTKAEGRTVEVVFSIEDRDLAAAYQDAFNEVVALTSHDAPMSFVYRARFVGDSLFTRPAFRVVLWFHNRRYEQYKQQTADKSGILFPHQEYRTHDAYKAATYQPFEYANALRGQQTRMLLIDYSEREHIQDKFATIQDYHKIVHDPRLLTFTRDTVLHEPRLVLVRAMNRVMDWVHSCLYNTTFELGSTKNETEPLPGQKNTISLVPPSLYKDRESKWNYRDGRYEVQHWVQDHGWIAPPSQPDPLLRDVLPKLDT